MRLAPGRNRPNIRTRSSVSRRDRLTHDNAYAVTSGPLPSNRGAAWFAQHDAHEVGRVRILASPSSNPVARKQSLATNTRSPDYRSKPSPDYLFDEAQLGVGRQQGQLLLEIREKAGGNLGGRNRSAEIKPLNLIAVDLIQKGHLLGGFAPFD